MRIDNEKIDRIGAGREEEYFKFVGMRLDEHLTWKYHTDHVRGKVASAVYALSKLRNLLTVYNSLFRSCIEFGIS